MYNCLTVCSLLFTAQKKRFYFQVIATCSPPVLMTLHFTFTVADAHAIIKVLDHQYWWLAGGYELEIGHFQKWLAWLIVAFLHSVFSRCTHSLVISEPKTNVSFLGFPFMTLK